MVVCLLHPLRLSNTLALLPSVLFFFKSLLNLLQCCFCCLYSGFFFFFFFGWRHVGSDLPYQQSNPHLPHWKAKSLTLDNQRSSPSALNALPL